MEASVLASTTGLRWGRINTPVPNLMVVVAPATNVSHTNGSGIGIELSAVILPLGAYG